ncbi:MAG TPA: hypothetical protein VMC84_11730 [Methanocella sp.]|uniref:hypothetical protein n=1 Tax=Methanocella sp. TaxID=2052833 RepID=UPI002C7065CA|nr:hypothetical protein [Methanocella sp.]HTY91837.1 hypothetical protein [Methanocella sp.]
MKSTKLSAKLTITIALFLLLATAMASADSGKPSISVSDVQISPSALMPGDTGTVTVTLANGQKTLTGSTTTSSDTYNYGAGSSNGLTTPAHTSVSSTTSSNTPDGGYLLNEVTLLADPPMYIVSKDFNDVGRMGMGDKGTFTFTIKADSSAADGTYTLTLKVRTDDTGIYLNYPVRVQVDSDEPQLIVSKYAETYNGTDNNVVSLDVTNPRSTPIDSVKVLASGGEFVFEPQEFYIGTLKAGDMYTADIKVDSRGDSYNSTPQFTMVYRNGDNWHQIAAISVTAHAARKTWWDMWWPYGVLGAVCLVAVVGLSATLVRRFGKKSH